MYYLHALRFEFWVHPAGFVLHVPHAHSAAEAQYFQERRAQVRALAQCIAAEIGEGRYQPRVTRLL